MLFPRAFAFALLWCHQEWRTGLFTPPTSINIGLPCLGGTEGPWALQDVIEACQGIEAFAKAFPVCR